MSNTLKVLHIAWDLRSADRIVARGRLQPYNEVLSGDPLVQLPSQADFNLRHPQSDSETKDAMACKRGEEVSRQEGRMN